MYILGINISHHPSVALLKDSEIVYYLEDDRWNRKKEEEWSVPNMFVGALASRFQSLEDIKSYTDHVDHIIFASDVNFYEDKQIVGGILSKLDEINLSFDKLHYYHEHHLYHACAAFYATDFDEAAALVMDGGGADLMGHKECESMYYFKDNEYEVVKKVYGSKCELEHEHRYTINDEKIILTPNMSCGSVYGRVTDRIGFGSQPGKTMGLASFGELDDDSEWFPNGSQDVQAVKNSIENRTSDKNLAKKAQEETKKHTINLIGELLEKTGAKNLVLSGGYFLNCTNNFEYVKVFPQINFYVDPMAHDGGTSIGATKYIWHHVLNKTQRHSLQSLYLGPNLN